MKRATSINLLLQVPKHYASKQMALYAALREAIVTQAIAPDRQLPSTREFARAHGVSRGTAVVVYELLQAEGYLATRRGTGTFVAPAPPDERLILQNGESVRALSSKGSATAPTELLSRRGRQFVSAISPIENARRGPVPFAPYLPALDEFPTHLWARLTARHARLVKPDLLGNDLATRWPRLRRAIAAYLKSTRGIDCEHEQIILTASTEQSLLLCTRLLSEPGDQALIEDPGYPGARAALQNAGLAILPVPVDAHGIQIDAIASCPGRPRLAYVTPAHQCPTGAVMSVERRHALLDWAARHDAWIFEDDDESEFRYQGHPLPALYGMSDRGRVLYAGSFDKTLFPALCISYLVVPASLVDAFARLQAMYRRSPPMLSQMVLCDFIENGHFVRHVRRMRECYGERGGVLIDALQAHLGGAIEVAAQPSGLELAVWWKSVGDADVRAAAAAQNVYVESMSSVRKDAPGGAVLGFAAYNAALLRDAVGQLARAVESISTGQATSAARLPVSDLAGPTSHADVRQLSGAA